MFTVVFWLALTGGAGFDAALAAEPVVAGSKKFTESVILGEMITQLVRDAGAEAVHRRELGGTRFLWDGLRAGHIDVYPDYTGTLREEILADRDVRDAGHLREVLGEHGILMSEPLGFNNTYAIGMKASVADGLGITRISDLRGHPDLVLGFGNEFMDRGDGWPRLRQHYGLPQRDVQGLDHDLAYRGLDAESIHVIDLYSTDAEIEYYGLRVLEDDRHLFPEYHAVLLYREELARRAPQAAEAMLRLEGLLSDSEMTRLNRRARIERVAEARVAADFLAERFGIEAQFTVTSTTTELVRHGRQHLWLTGVSLSLAILVAVPLGVVGHRFPRVGQVILSGVGVIQTIPSLALLVFMIPLFGIGAKPAIGALFLYSLLPIVRNTYTGLKDIPPAIRESAEALGLKPAARLRLIELPLASRAILAGVKTSAVINVGTATLGALIGAGGYGQPILTGIRLNDFGLIMQGAVPAAGLALVAQGFFDLAERLLVPKALRAKRAS